MSVERFNIGKGLTQSEAWAIVRKRLRTSDRRPFTYDPRTGECVVT